MGLKIQGDVTIDGAQLQEWKNGIVNRLTTGVGFLLSKNGATTIHGHAEFKSKNELIVTDKDGGTREIGFKKAIIATGARAATLPFLPIGDRVMDYRGALDIHWVPKTMTVIGGGVIGLELGSVFQRFGSKLNVVELTDSLLPGTDPELVKVVERSMKRAGAKIHKNTGATGITRKEDGKQYITAKDKKGKEIEIESEVVLVAIGFKPNSDKVGAENAGLAIDDTGHFTVNEHRQTNVPHIYAIGDVAGLPWLAHKASKEGIVAAEHAAGLESTWDVRAMPAAAFTHPEIATVGLQEHEAKAEGRDVKVAKFPFTALGRALSVNETEGMVKMICDPETDEVLGVGAVGYQASDLIAEAALAIEMGATAMDIGLTVHAHPDVAGVDDGSRRGHPQEGHPHPQPVASAPLPA